MKYLFGPVPSRRLGISLGVDLVPHKVCTLNCVFCEVGITTTLTTQRKEYVPIDEVINELEAYLSQKPELDYITFSGQGEPTLNSGLGRVVSYLKDNHPGYKIALLTNGTLFWDAGLRAEVSRIELILPSLNAATDLIFRKIDRSCASLDNNQIIEGLIQLRKEFAGKIYLEVFLVPGLNDTDTELSLLKEAILKINPDLVQLNSLDRPGPEPWVKHMTAEKLDYVASFLKPLPVEIVAKATSRKSIQSFQNDISQQILDTIKRRPCTDQDLCDILGLHKNELNKYLSQLLDEDLVESQHMERGLFFLPNKSE
jgi:wyosine [tRNA(Phe)-imidazoG37] synthetase (radical SAM superfamily)